MRETTQKGEREIRRDINIYELCMPLLRVGSYYSHRNFYYLIKNRDVRFVYFLCGFIAMYSLRKKSNAESTEG